MNMKLIVLLMLVSSCNYRIDKNAGKEISVPGEMMETVSYQQVKEEVFTPKCIACHGNLGGVNLESHTSAHGHLDAIRKSVLEAKTMPKAPVSGLTDRQYELITAWVDAGGPDKPIGGHQPSGGTDTSEEENNPNAINFQSIKKNIIDKKCLSCHMAGEQAGNVPFETREQLISSSLRLIVPGKPEDSSLYTITAPGVMNMMPPYPVAPLTKTQRMMLEKWILQGAK